jgi:hypothetical protein
MPKTLSHGNRSAQIGHLQAWPLRRRSLPRLAVMWSSAKCGAYSRFTRNPKNRCTKPDFLRHIFEAVMAALHASNGGRSCSANYSITHPLSYATRRLRMQSLAQSMLERTVWALLVVAQVANFDAGRLTPTELERVLRRRTRFKASVNSSN